MRRNVLLIAGALVLLGAGVIAGVALKIRERPDDKLDTRLAGISVTRAKPPTKPRKRTFKYLPSDRVCWRFFGGNPQRTLSRPSLRLGRPTRHFWVRGLRSYIEYPPSYCNGIVYVNTYLGVTFALDAHNGRVLWRRRSRGHKPSTPAIAGSLVIVSATDGTVTAFERTSGRLVWRFRVEAKVESSPVVVDGTVYFGATDGRLFALAAATGRVRWAYDTGGRINSSPVIHRDRVCITTYAGSIFCLRLRDGHKLWSTYVRRDPLRDESFYASASTDGRRLYTISRAGKVVALLLRSGRVLWTRKVHSLGYSTPAVAHGRVFVGDFNGRLHAYRAGTGYELWSTYVGGRILGPAVVVGRLVFFSTLETETYAAKVSNGQVVWHLGIGKYSPGIATDRHYFFSLNGILAAYHATTPARYRVKKPRRERRHAKPARKRGGRLHQRRVTTAPKR